MEADPQTTQMEVDPAAQPKQEDLSGDGGVLKTVLVEGKDTETPASGSDVKVHYTGTLLDGTKFDSSRDRNEPFKFKLGAGQVIKGWDLTVATMKRDERCRVVLRSDYAYGKSGSPPSIPPDATLVFDIELISWQDEEDLTHDGGVLKKILVAPPKENWERPKDDEEVKISYTLRTADGEVIETKTDYSVVLGTETLPSGLEKGIESMRKGEKALFKLTGEYHKGSPAQAPADAVLHYEVELHDYTKQKASWEMTNDEKLTAAQKSKDEGNDLFKAGKYQGAIKKYKKSLSFVESDYSFTDEEKKQAKPLRVTAHLNTAACNLKLKAYKPCIEACDKALKLDANNIKALFRKGQAFNALDEWQSAEDSLNRALEIEPENKEVQRERMLLKRKIAEQEKKDKKRYANMFARLREEEPSS